MEYQRGTTPVDAYYDVALTILDGDAGSLLALAGKLPDEAKKTELLAFHERRTRRRQQQRQQQIKQPQQPEPPRSRPRRSPPRDAWTASRASARWRPSIASTPTHPSHPPIGPRKPTTNTSTNSPMPPTPPTRLRTTSCANCSPTRTTRTAAPSASTRASPCSASRARTRCAAGASSCGGSQTRLSTPSLKTEPRRRRRRARCAARRSRGSPRASRPPRRGGRRGTRGVPTEVPRGVPSGLAPSSRGGRSPGAPELDARRGRERVRCRQTTGFGPADYRAYGDSWASQEQSGRTPEGIRKASGCERIDADDADSPIVVWFRQDLRVRDNPALHAAARTGRPVVTCFAWCPGEEGGWPMGGATRYWLHHALLSLQASLRARYGGDLVVRDATGNGNVTGNVTGNGCGTSSSSSSSSFDELAAVVRECGAKDVYCNRVYEPWKIARDGECERRLAAELNVRFRSFNAGVLYEPWDARPDATDDACWNSGYGSVRFFLRGCARLGEPPPPLPPPPTMRVRLPAERRARSVGVDALRLARMPRRGKGGGTNGGSIIDWAAGIRDAWTFGEDGAVASLREFLNDGSLERFDAKSARTYSEHGGGSIGGGHKTVRVTLPRRAPSGSARTCGPPRAFPRTCDTAS